VPRTEKQQDIRALPDDALADFQERRRERGMLLPRALHQPHHLVGTVLPARDIHVIGSGFLQRQPNKLTASLDLRPVIEFVAHGHSPLSRLRGSII
jgi:hypothetical protein